MAASPGRSQLERLPNELLHNIGSECGIKHLASLIRCNKDLYDRLYPLLIKTEVRLNHGRAALWAVDHGRLGLLRSLHRRGLSITQHWGRERKDGWGLEHDILGHCDRKIIIPDPTGKMCISFSLLHVACSRGFDRIISWLLDHGAVIDEAINGVNPCDSTAHRYKVLIRAPVAWTPLELAICRRRTSSVELLLERATATSDRTAVGGPRGQALHIAVLHGHHDVVDVLLRSGRYDINAPNAHNELPVNLRGDGYRVHLPTLRVLLQAKPDLTIESFCQKSIFFRKRRVTALPLHDAIAAGEYEAALLLVEAGADATALCGGLYPLHCAFLSGKADEKGDELSRLRLLKALLARGADPNARTSLDDFTGATPLMLAAWYAPYPEIIKLFLKHGADVNADDEGGQNALQWAVGPYLVFDHIPGIPDMDDRGFLTNIKMGRAVRLLLEKGCSVGEKNKEGRCALQHFAEHDKEARAFEHVLAHHPEECAAAGCLDEALRISLMAGCFDNAYWLTDAGTSPSEEMVLEAMGILAEKAKDAREPTYMDVHYVLDDCKTFAEYAGVFGKDLQAYIANYEKACPRVEENYPLKTFPNFRRT